MDVGTMKAQFNRFTVQSQSATASYAAQKNSAGAADSAAIGDAYAVNISDAAKLAQQESKATVTTTSMSVTVEETSIEVKSKGLTNDEIQALKDNQTVNEQTFLNIMIQAMTDNNNKLQGWLDSGVGVLNFGGVQIDAARFGLPEVATNPEDAKKAISEGGQWSVDAVSTRIFDLASAIAGGDPEKLQEMRAAVEEGFKQAGLVWEKETGSSSMPDITKQTYNELMHRFDAQMQSLTGA